MNLPDVVVGIGLLLVSVAILAAGLRTAFALILVSAGCVGLWMLIWIGALEGTLYAATQFESVAISVTAMVSTQLGQFLFSCVTGLLALAVPCAIRLRFRFGSRQGNYLVAALVCSIGAAIVLQPVLLPDIVGLAALWILYAGSAVLAFASVPFGSHGSASRSCPEMD